MALTKIVYCREVKAALYTLNEPVLSVSASRTYCVVIFFEILRYYKDVASFRHVLVTITITSIVHHAGHAIMHHAEEECTLLTTDG